MSNIRLSMPIGLQLEIARSTGLTNDELLDIFKTKNLQALKPLGEDDSEWEILFQFAEDNWGDFKEAVLNGYTFKFVPRNGLKHFMIYKYGLEEGKDFEFGENYFDHVKLKSTQVTELERMITQNWKITHLDVDSSSDIHEIKIELAVS